MRPSTHWLNFCYNGFCSLLHVLRLPMRLTWSSGKMLDPSNVFGQSSRGWYLMTLVERSVNLHSSLSLHKMQISWKRFTSSLPRRIFLQGVLRECHKSLHVFNIMGFCILQGTSLCQCKKCLELPNGIRSLSLWPFWLYRVSNNDSFLSFPGTWLSYEWCLNVNILLL